MATANKEDFTLTITRRSKAIGFMMSGDVSLNNHKVGALKNGGTVIVKGHTGDSVRIGNGGGGDYQFKVRDAGELALRMKMSGDLSWAVFFLPSIIYKWSRDGLGVVPCRSRNHDLDRGAFEGIQRHGSCLSCWMT
uniref:Uncharacterized protein n=1 Tax=Amphora coffeiformis TaxID=265554 RepID=A0A7S3P8B9_9STRA|eukprot:scaffold7808_cov184-Amphora_coffeaeformis.AAC.34